MYGNTFELAKTIVEGAKSIEGAEVVLKQVPDLLPEEVIEGNPKIKEAKENKRIYLLPISLNLLIMTR